MTGRGFSDRLKTSEEVESVMHMHVRHFATVSIVKFFRKLYMERRIECHLWDMKNDRIVLTK